MDQNFILYYNRFGFYLEINCLFVFLYKNVICFIVLFASLY